MLDEFFNIMPLTHDSYMRGRYMFIGDDYGITLVHNNVFELTFPNDEDELPKTPGYYEWNEEEDEWINLDDKITRLQNTIHNIKLAFEVGKSANIATL